MDVSARATLLGLIKGFACHSSPKSRSLATEGITARISSFLISAMLGVGVLGPQTHNLHAC